MATTTTAATTNGPAVEQPPVAAAAGDAPNEDDDADVAEEHQPEPELTPEERQAELERLVEQDRAEFGYALGNSVVRRYTVADVHTARKALNDNIGSVLANDLGAELVTGVTDLRTVISAVSIVIGIASHAAPIPFPESYNFIVGCIVAYYMLTALSIYVWRMVEGDGFLTVCVAGRTNSSGKKGKGGATAGSKKYVQFSSSVERFKAEYTLKAQIIQPASFPLFPPKRVGAPVERTYFFGKFFSERGLIHPGSVRKEAERLLSDMKLA